MKMNFKLVSFLIASMLINIILNVQTTTVEAQNNIKWLTRLPFDTSAGARVATRTGRVYENDYLALGLTDYQAGEDYHPPRSYLRGAIDFSGVFPVVATEAGTVIPNNGDNCDLTIRHSDGTVAYYLHMRNILVNVGDTVQAGTPLGTSSDCGESDITGPHLHLAVFQGSEEIELRFNDVAERFDVGGSGLRCSAGLICPRRTNYVEFQYTYTGVSIPRITNLAWDFSEGVPQGWIPNGQLENVRSALNALRARVTGSDPQLISPLLAPLVADSYDRLELRMGTESAQCIQLFWRGEGQGWDGTRRILYDLPDDNGTFIIPLSTMPNWNGSTITQLRFDPACRLGTGTNEIRIDSIRFLRPDDSTAMNYINWNFARGIPQGWQATNHLAELTQRDGGMWARVTGDDPRYLSPIMEPFNADTFNQFYFSMSTLEAQCVEIFWRGPNQAFDGTRRVLYDINRNGNYTIDLSAISSWSGQIEQLRFDPACRLDPEGDANGVGVRINTIQLRNAETAPPEVFELILDPATSELGVGEEQSITMLISNPELAPSGAIRGLDVACNVDNPALLMGLQQIDGDAFPNDAVSITLPNPAFNPDPDFHWLISIPEATSGVTSDGIVLTTRYQAMMEGVATINCAVEALDSDGNLIEAVAINDATIEIAGNGSISGLVNLEYGSDHSNIEISLVDNLGNVVTTTTTDALGNFTFSDIEPNIYSVTADAEGYLGISTTQIAVAGDTSLPNGILIAGDVNNDNVIDLLDVTQFASDYSASPTLAVDFDRNGSLDLRDFSFLVNNLDLIGPMGWN